MSKLLLHTCCGPCSTYVVKSLREQGFELTGYFYNPNINPPEEHEHRLATMRQYAAAVGLPLLTPSVPRLRSGHLPLIKGENEVRLKPKDCETCYRVRLQKTAETAGQKGFASYSTTLLISPYQKIELIKKIGDEIGAQLGVKFLCQDFQKGYRESRAMARGLKLYMQRYCGCQS